MELHAYQTGQSAATPLLLIVIFIVEMERCVFVAFLDLEGAFNDTTKETIRRGIEEHVWHGSLSGGQ